MPSTRVLALVLSASPGALLVPLSCTDKDPLDTGATAPLTTTMGPSGPDATTDAVDPTTAGPTAADTTAADTTAADTTAADTTAADTTAADTTVSVTTTVSTTVDSTTTGDGTTTTDDTTGAVGDPCEGDAPKIRLSTTLGDMVVQLDAVQAPITTANFIAYVQDGFYDGTIFHRVIDDFVIQGGGFTPDLQQKPTNPPIPLEISDLIHVNGAISMARTNDPNSATSQFFVCDGPQDFLDGQYAVFGVLVEGFDVLATIAAVPTNADDVPIDPVIVNEAVCVP